MIDRLIWLRFKRLYASCLIRRRRWPPVIRDHLQAFVQLDLRRPICTTDFVVFDTETTGLHARKGDRIVSISAVRIKEGRIDLSDAFHELVNPDRNIPPKAAVVHGILPRMVDGKPTLDQILPSFVQYMGSSILVGHHAWLDMSFLNRGMINLYGLPIQNLVLDTVILDEAFGRLKAPSSHATMKLSSSLSALAERYHVRINGRHSSLGDALATAQIFQQILKESRKYGIFSLGDLVRKS